MLPSLPADKANHTLYGNFAALLGAWLAPQLGLPLWQSAALCTLVVGALKEAWDAYSKQGTPELGDFLATCLGGAPVTSLAYAVG